MKDKNKPPGLPPMPPWDGKPKRRSTLDEISMELEGLTKDMPSTENSQGETDRPLLWNREVGQEAQTPTEDGEEGEIDIVVEVVSPEQQVVQSRDEVAKAVQNPAEPVQTKTEGNEAENIKAEEGTDPEKGVAVKEEPESGEEDLPELELDDIQVSEPPVNAESHVRGIADKIKQSSEKPLKDLYKEVLNAGGIIIDEPKKIGNHWIAKVKVNNQFQNAFGETVVIKNRQEGLPDGICLVLKNEDAGFEVLGGNKAEVLDQLTVETMFNSIETAEQFRQFSREIEDFQA